VRRKAQGRRRRRRRRRRSFICEEGYLRENAG